MRRFSEFPRVSVFLLICAAALLGVRPASAQTLRDLNATLAEIEPQVSQGVSNPQMASDAIDRLDQAEADFARIAEGGRIDQEALLDTYQRLDAMLERLYRTYSNQKDACINTIDHGGNCDYEEPEQLALRALYPLSWLRFEGALLYKSQPYEARRLLNQAIDGFTDSTLVILSPELVRENLLGRAYAERELGRFDRGEYNRAITDFKRIMQDGPGTRQYRPAEQGLASTYASMGRMNEAQGLTGQLAEEENGPQRRGIEMLHLRELFRAEAVAPDAPKRAQLKQQILDFIRARQNDKDGWAVAVAATAQYAGDPVALFGGSDDGFENWLLANVLYYQHRTLEAAKYYWAAAHSGKYPKAYKYAADLYYSQGRLDMVEKVADEIAAQPGNPDAQWATYMRFKIPRIEWERSGRRSAALKTQWMDGADDYLKHYPRGQYAFEPRFRLAELLQQKGDFLGAAKQYEQVSGNSDYDFTARFNAAECYYRALGPQGAENKPGGPLPPAQLAAVRADAIRTMRQAIAMEPNAERYAPSSQRRALHDSRGRGILMLATLLQSEPVVNYREVASLLNGYETQYPAMSQHFNQIFEWRIQALDHTAQYAELEREISAFTAHDAPQAQNDFIKEIGLDFWKNSHAAQSAGNLNGAREDAKLTAMTYEYFERMVNEGKMPAKNLTGTLSILGQAYLRQDDVAKADATFEQVVKADPGSPDANAGLARIAQTRKNYRDALDLWSRVESVAAESDPLFYEAKYNMAEIFAQEGNIHSACNKLAVTRSEHPNLGSPGMKAQWGALQQRICENHTES
ncbi:MAG TPA: tetratricopeptide repeat protein [Candidatus Binataceae bacterium]|nr:tetratricopeptide repeat protein [Candidatus Binataceae bacterium]